MVVMAETFRIHDSVQEAARRVRSITERLIALEDGQTISSQVLEALASIEESLPNQDSSNRLWNNGHALLNRSPVTGVSNPLAPPLELIDTEEGQTIAHVTPGIPYQGPPGRLHGGFVAVFLDHVMGIAASKASDSEGAYTRSLTVEYKDATPLHKELEIGATLERKDGRKLWMTGWINSEGQQKVTASGLWIEIPR